MLFAVVVGLPEETNGTMETQEKLLTETETRSPLSTVYACTVLAGRFPAKSGRQPIKSELCQ